MLDQPARNSMSAVIVISLFRSLAPEAGLAEKLLGHVLFGAGENIALPVDIN